MKEVVMYLRQRRFCAFDILFASAFTLALATEDSLMWAVVIAVFLIAEILFQIKEIKDENGK